MDIHELRVGNKVLNPYHGKIYTVEGFKYSREPGGERRAFVSTFEHSQNSVTISILQPIPVSEKWLGEAGAKPSPDGKVWQLDNFKIEKKSDGYYVSPKEGYDLKIAYVHDLQNLYYYHHQKKELEFSRQF